MTIASLFQAVVQHIQFLGLLYDFDLVYPRVFKNFIVFLNLGNVDFNSVMGSPKVRPLEFRTMFMLISICGPLLINLLLLLIFMEYYIVLWYIGMCFGVVLLLMGLITLELTKRDEAAGKVTTGLFDSAANKFGSTSQSDPKTVATYFIVLGSILLFVAILAVLAFLAYKRFFSSADTESRQRARRGTVNVFQEKDNNLLGFHRKRAFVQVIQAMMLFVAGLILLTAVDVIIPGGIRTKQLLSDADGSLNFMALAAGVVCLILTVLSVIYFVINLFESGRAKMLWVNKFLQANVLLVLLSLISASYMPVLRYAVEIFTCAPYQCPPGKIFNPYAERPASSYDTSQTRFCDVCNITTVVESRTCGRKAPQYDFCGAGFPRTQMVWKYPDTPCDDDATTFFFMAAAVVLACYAVVIPGLFAYVINFATNKVVRRAAVAAPEEGETAESVYQRKLKAIIPAASSLYDPFVNKRRFYILITMFHRLIITLTVGVAAAHSRTAVAVMLGVHIFACIVLAYFRPYLWFSEMVLVVLFGLLAILNSAYAVWVWQDNLDNRVFDTLPGVEVMKPSEGPGIALIIINVLVPVGGVIFVVYRQIKKVRKPENPESMSVLPSCHQTAVRGEGGESTTGPIPIPRKMDYDDAIALQAAEKNNKLEEKKTAKRRATIVPPTALLQGLGDEATREAENDPSLHKSGMSFYQRRASFLPGARLSISKIDDKDMSGSGDAAVDLAVSEEVEVQGIVTEEDQMHHDKARRAAWRSYNEKRAEALNEDIKGMLNKTFMAIGIFLVVVLGVTAFAHLRYSDRNFLIGSYPNRLHQSYSLAGYGTWDNFTDHCCCTEQTTENEDFVTAERWVCANGKIVERGRVNRDGDNGLGMRGLCSTTFTQNPVTTLVVDRQTGMPALRCSTGAQAFDTLSRSQQKLKISQKYDKYWRKHQPHLQNVSNLYVKDFNRHRSTRQEGTTEDAGVSAQVVADKDCDSFTPFASGLAKDLYW